MSQPKLHLDADVSLRAVTRALTQQGYDVSRTPNEWMPEDASDETQLLRATAQGRLILTFNVGDFMRLVAIHRNHAGVLLAHQNSWTPAGLIRALGRVMQETTAEEWHGQVRWLNDWR